VIRQHVTAGGTGVPAHESALVAGVTEIIR
jgi:hypothetical protein